MGDDIAIKVEGVYKDFRLPHEKGGSIKQSLLSAFRPNHFRYERQQVLKNISFEIKKGEFFGIVGRNGSGKSTLLKILAGIYQPTKGSVQVNGRLVPFIELGVGFNPELSGRENVFLNGALLGFSEKEITEMYAEIVEFAELEKFMDQKLKNYSSGMQVRLAFSIAIRADSDILLIDEVLAVGDTNFQKKCLQYFKSLKINNKTVVFVTHDMNAVENYCDRVAYINSSELVGIDVPKKITHLYKQLNSSNNKDNQGSSKSWGTKEVIIEKVSIYKNNPKEQVHAFRSGEPLTIEIILNNKIKQPVIVGIAFEDQYGINISGPNTISQGPTLKSIITYRIPRIPFAEGSYNITVVAFDKDAIVEYHHIEKSNTIDVYSNDNIHGKVDLFGEWEFLR